MKHLGKPSLLVTNIIFVLPPAPVHFGLSIQLVCTSSVVLKFLISWLDSIVDKTLNNGKIYLWDAPYASLSFSHTHANVLPWNHRWGSIASIYLWNWTFNSAEVVWNMAGEKSKGKCARSKTSILIDAAPFLTILVVGNGLTTVRSPLCYWDFRQKNRKEDQTSMIILNHPWNARCRFSIR